jgi:hypothetical protein
VSHSALPHYQQMIAGFDPRQAARALRAFTDSEVYSVLRSTTGQRQWPALLDLLGPKLTLSADRALFEAVRTLPGPPDMLLISLDRLRRCDGCAAALGLMLKGVGDRGADL